MSHISRSNKPRYQQRQFEAQVRKDLAAKRSPAEQLARLDAARLPAVKERRKLHTRLGAAAAPVESTPQAAAAAPGSARKGKKARKAARAAGNA